MNKEKLTQVLDYGYQQVCDFVADLSDEQRAAVGAPDRWSAKDVVAHLTEWMARLAQDLEQVAQPESQRLIPPNYDDIDEANAEIYAQYQGQSWEEILVKTERSFAAIRDHAQAAAESELGDVHRIPWREGRPLWRMLVGAAVEHPVLHLGYYHLGNDNLAEACRLQETTASRLLELDDSPTWRGVQVYNLACIQALAGQKEKALVNLAEALHLMPDLSEWSRQDADLATLHDDPQYQALYV